MNRDDLFQAERAARFKKSIARARPPALPSGLLFSNPKTVTSYNRPMFFRVKNDEYAAPLEQVMDDLAYQITLENDQYISSQSSLRTSNGRRPEKMLKVEKSRGLFAHIEDSDLD